MSHSETLTTADRIERLREFDLDRINTQMRANGHDNVEELEAKFRRFMQLIIENPGSEFTPSEAVDEYWHTFILDTREYQRFCDEVVGHFVHHVPTVED